LSALRRLGPYLKEESLDATLDEATGKTRTQLDEMIARRFPRPNAPTVEISAVASMTTATAGATPLLLASAPACPARIEPLSANGVLVQMTMTAEGYADLKRAKELLGHCIPDGDTVKVIERALRTLIEDLEKDRRAKTSRPQARVRPSKPGHIPAATRREVFARDGEQYLHAAEEIFGKEHVAARIHCRQQQWMRRAGEKRGEVRSSATSDRVEQATRGLVNMGFGASAVNKTLVALVGRHRDAGAPPLPELLREAIAALTS
jgi:hypothetical protein